MNTAIVARGPQSLIHTLPNRPPFMLDYDVAEAYGVGTKQLNQARNRNSEKFPGEDFCFELTESEVAELVTNCDRLQPKKHASVLPFGYTKKGAHMFATILKTPQAIEHAIILVEGFSRFEEMLHDGAGRLTGAELLSIVRQVVKEENNANRLHTTDFYRLRGKAAPPVSLRERDEIRQRYMGNETPYGISKAMGIGITQVRRIVADLVAAEEADQMSLPEVTQ